MTPTRDADENDAEATDVARELSDGRDRLDKALKHLKVIEGLLDPQNELPPETRLCRIFEWVAHGRPDVRATLRDAFDQLKVRGEINNALRACQIVASERDINNALRAFQMLA